MRIFRRWILSAAATCWLTFPPFSAASMSFSARSTDDRAPPRRKAAAELRLHAGESRVGESANGDVSAGPSAIRGDPYSVACASAVRRLVAAKGDRGDGGVAGHGENPRARSRDLLHDVQSIAGRPLPRAVLRHDTVHAARRRRTQRDAATRGRPRERGDRRRHVLLDRGRVSRCVRQRADGADQRRLLRGSHAGNTDPHPQRSRGGAEPEARSANRSAKFSSDRRRTHADRSIDLHDAGPEQRGSAGSHAGRRDNGLGRITRCSPTRTAYSKISMATTAGASTARGRAAAGTAPRRSWKKAVTASSTK